MIWTDNYGKKKERTGENIFGKMWKTEDGTDKGKFENMAVQRRKGQ